MFTSPSSDALELQSLDCCHMWHASTCEMRFMVLLVTNDIKLFFHVLIGHFYIICLVCSNILPVFVDVIFHLLEVTLYILDRILSGRYIVCACICMHRKINY